MFEGMKLIAGGLCSSAMAGSGIGIGIIFGSLIRALAQNPFMYRQMFTIAVLGFALTEAIALFAMMMAFLLVFAF